MPAMLCSLPCRISAVWLFLVLCGYWRHVVGTFDPPCRPIRPVLLSVQLVLRTQDVKESVRKAAFRTLGEDVREGRFIPFRRRGSVHAQSTNVFYDDVVMFPCWCRLLLYSNAVGG